MFLVIKTAEIVMASERHVAAILWEDETITRIDRNITLPGGAKVVGAKCKFVGKPGHEEFVKRTPNHF